MADDKSKPKAGMISIQQACALLMLTKARISQLVAEGYIPKAARNEYPLVGVVQGYIRFRDDADRRKTQSAAESGLKAARQAEIEMRMAERRRELISRDAAYAAMDGLVGQINKEFGGFAARVTRDPAIRRKIEETLDEALNAIADRASGGKSSLASGSADVSTPAEDIA